MLAKNQEASQQDALNRLEEILRKATRKKASDIHLKAGLPPIVRINGQLYYLRDPGSAGVVRLRNYEIKEIAYSLMNEKHRARFEEGLEIDLGFEIDTIGRYRINICKQRGEPRIVCRYIPEDIKSIAELGMPRVVEKLSLLGRGLVLVTGPTGSGKSTLLAAMIDHITLKRSCHIVTIEDPIEFIFKDRKSIVTQREVGLDTPDFKHSLKYALRQDPDVILVGEMRDEETTLMALSAAETGHLVLSSMHTSDARETINRILGNVPKNRQDQVRQQLATQLQGIVSLRLPRRKDGEGRVPATEIMIHNRRVQDFIANPSKTLELKKVMENSKSMGMLSMDQSLMELIQKDLITEEEALFHCDNVRDFKLRLEGVSGLALEESEQEEGQKVQDQLKAKFEAIDNDFQLDSDEDDELSLNETVDTEAGPYRLNSPSKKVLPILDDDEEEDDGDERDSDS